MYDLKRILQGAGISSFENIRLPFVKRIVMSTNHDVDSQRDVFTFDFDNNLIKIKQYLPKKINGEIKYIPYTNHDYDIYLDMNLVVGIEMVSPLI